MSFCRPPPQPPSMPWQGLVSRILVLHTLAGLGIRRQRREARGQGEPRKFDLLQERRQVATHLVSSQDLAVLGAGTHEAVNVLYTISTLGRERKNLGHVGDFPRAVLQSCSL